MAYPSHPPPPPPQPQQMGSSNVVYNTELRFDSAYLKTQTGVLKTLILICSLIGFICIEASYFKWNGRGVFFNVVAFFNIVLVLPLNLAYLFHVVEKYHNVRWLLGELVLSVVMFFFNLIASTIVVAFGSAAFSAAGFFGYLSMAFFGFNGFLTAVTMRAGTLAQGSRVTVKEPHVITPPALP